MAVWGMHDRELSEARDATQPQIRRVGAAIPREELPAIELRPAGTGPLHALIPHHAGAAVGVAQHLVDGHGDACSAVLFSDGRRRCLPAKIQTSTSHHYADSACSDTQRVTMVFPDLCGMQPTHVAYNELLMCESQYTSVHELLEPFTGPLFGRYSGICQEVRDQNLQIPKRRLGPALPLDTFPVIERGIE